MLYHVTLYWYIYIYLFIASTVDYKDIGEKKGTGTVIFPKCSNKTCVNIMIKPDNEIEAEEIFTVSVKSKLSNSNNSVVINGSYSTATIRILPHSQSQN